MFFNFSSVPKSVGAFKIGNFIVISSSWSSLSTLGLLPLIIDVPPSSCYDLDFLFASIFSHCYVIFLHALSTNRSCSHLYFDSFSLYSHSLFSIFSSNKLDKSPIQSKSPPTSWLRNSGCLGSLKTS